MDGIFEEGQKSRREIGREQSRRKNGGGTEEEGKNHRVRRLKWR
jgi:hypothetical protein